LESPVNLDGTRAEQNKELRKKFYALQGWQQCEMEKRQSASAFFEQQEAETQQAAANQQTAPAQQGAPTQQGASAQPATTPAAGTGRQKSTPLAEETLQPLLLALDPSSADSSKLSGVGLQKRWSLYSSFLEELVQARYGKDVALMHNSVMHNSVLVKLRNIRRAREPTVTDLEETTTSDQ